MNRERVLYLADEEARLRRRFMGLMQAKKRLMNIIGDDELSLVFIKVITALNEAEREYDAVLMEIIREGEGA